MTPVEIERMSGERKAAILVVMLGEEASNLMFGHLSKREVAKIAREVADLGVVEPDLGHAVLEQYYLRALKAPPVQGGPELARRILSAAAISEDVVDQLVMDPTKSPTDKLEPLLEAPPAQLARALEDEHPQTTALVLLNLPPARAAALLAALPEAQRAKTVLRMAQVKLVPSEIMGDVAVSLHERLGRAVGTKQAENGVQRAASVLGRMPRAASKRLLDELEVEHPEHVQDLRDRLYTFESLLDVDNRGMQELLRSVEGGKIGLALDGAEEALQNKFVSNLSERAANRLREDMELTAKATREDKEEARREILNTALRLEAEGKLSFAEPAG